MKSFGDLCPLLDNDFRQEADTRNTYNDSRDG